MLCAGLKLLIVEDEPIIADAMALELREAGCARLVQARDVKSALDIAASTPIDAAVLDVDLAGRNIWPIAEALDALRVPFVLVTDYATLSVPRQFEGRPTLTRPLKAGNLALALQSVTGGSGRPHPSPVSFTWLGGGRRASSHMGPAIN